MLGWSRYFIIRTSLNSCAEGKRKRMILLTQRRQALDTIWWALRSRGERSRRWSTQDGGGLLLEVGCYKRWVLNRGKRYRGGLLLEVNSRDRGGFLLEVGCYRGGLLLEVNSRDRGGF